MSSDQSQAPLKLEHHHLRRASLRLGSKLSLTRIELQVLQNFIEYLSWNDFDPRQLIDRTRDQFMADLEIKHTSPISEAFSKLEHLGLMSKVRIKGRWLRQLTDKFIDYCASCSGHQPMTRQKVRSLTDDPQGHSPMTRQVIPGLPCSMDRRLNGRINGNLNAAAGNRGNKTLAISIRTAIQKEMAQSHIPDDEFDKVHAEMMVLVESHKEEGALAFQEFAVNGLRIAKKRKRNDIPKVLTAQVLRGFIEDWQRVPAPEPENRPQNNDEDIEALMASIPF